MKDMQIRDLVGRNDRGEPVTTSLVVAEKFGKRHDNVLRAIDNLECSEQFILLNFEEISYVDVAGRKQRMVEMTKDGFAMLVMGFTGSAAAAWKEKFIAAFNEMERTLTGTLAVIDALHRSIKEQGENIGKVLVPVAQLSVDMQETKKMVLEHDTEIVSIKQHLQDIKTVNKRKPFSESTKHCYRLVVIRFYRNMCPCCQDVQIIDAKGVAIPGAQYEHWTERNRNWPGDGWIVCRACNSELEKFRHKYDKQFAVFQQRLEQITGPNDQLPLPLR